MYRTHTRIRRPRRGALGLAAVLLPLLLLVTLVGAQAPSVRPAQADAMIYLPLVNHLGAPASAGSPVIDNFQLSPSAGSMAGEVELRWRVSGATSLKIEPGVGDVRGAASAIVYPIATTTYTLTATNDKGSTSSTVTYTVNAMPMPDPLTVAARLDAGRAVSVSVGTAGGTVEATGSDGTRYTLSIPPEALLYTELITLTPVAGIDAMPFAASSVRAVSVAPEGLEFIEPATLIITPPAAPVAPHTVGFAFRGTGTEFHLRTAQGPDGSALAQAPATRSLSVVTARSYGAAEVSDDIQVAPLIRNPPSDPADIAEHVYNTTLDETLNTTVRRVQLLAHLQDHFIVTVGTQLTTASRNPEGPAPFDLESAARSYISWRARVRAAKLEEQLRPEISQANLLLGEALRKAGELATERCNQGRPAQGFALQRYIGYAKRFALVNTRTALEERLKNCWVFKLTFDATISATIPGSTDSDQVQSSFTMRFDSASGRVIGSGASTWGQVIHTQPDSSGQQCVQSITTTPSTFDAATGERGLSLSPVSRTSPNINVALAYDPGRPSGMVTWRCAKGVVVTYDLSLWIEQYKAFHFDELVGSDIVATKSEPAAANVLWEYQQSKPVGDGILVIEQTTLTIKHTPEP